LIADFPSDDRTHQDHVLGIADLVPRGGGQLCRVVEPPQHNMRVKQELA
jgi:hypothetical protein